MTYNALFLQATIDYFLIGTALAMDCFSVSISCGILQRRMGRQIWAMALLFGLFQAAMPILGWGLGDMLSSELASFNAWVACGLLIVLGIKMIWEGRKSASRELHADPSRLDVLLTLSVATSIDALTVGFSFTGMGLLTFTQILYPIAWIGCMSFLLSIFGKYIGVKVGRHLNLPAEQAAGVILILIGLKIPLLG